LLLDTLLAFFEGEPLPGLVARVAIMLVAVPGIAWLVARRVARPGLWANPEAPDQQYGSLLRYGSDATIVLDGDGVVRYISPSVESTLGYAPADLLETNVKDLVSPKDAATILDIIRDSKPGSRSRFECRIRQLDGVWVSVEAVATNLRDDPSVRGLVLTMHDVSRWKALEEQLTRQAFHDPLTGLPNRALYINRLEHALSRRRRHAKGSAVLFLDLDDFKAVNDSLGHVEADTLIGLVAARLAETIRPSDTAARLGGDEFALLLEEVDLEQATLVANRVLDGLNRPFQLGDRSLPVGVSIGIAHSSSGLLKATDMLRAADVAMYNAKDAGKGQFRIYEPSMQQATADRLRLGMDLRAAIDRNEFILHYQPIVELPGQTVVAMEALVRWVHPERGLIAPNEFIPVAETTGLIVQLGEFVLREACRQARAWQLARPDVPPLMMNVNLSGVQLQHPGLVAAVSLALEDAELAPELLTLEITESVMAGETETTIRRLRQLKGIGVNLAIDDFGKGYSSLTYLRRFPIDLVKIDKSFVDGIATGSDELALARAIVRLAHSLKMKTVAEGVEHEAQVKRLRTMGCDRAQGFQFAKPMDARMATAYVLGHTTISLWVGHLGHELEVINSVVADFEELNPDLRVEVVGGVYDDKIIAALRDGHGPNVVSSFESTNYGVYGMTSGLVDLGPYMARDHLDEDILNHATRAYTSYNGRQWALPMLADAYGLYYNKALFAEAKLSTPPKTISELTEYAKKLTRRRRDGSLSVVGFNPLINFYENSAGTFGQMFGARWIDATGKSSLSVDPAWARMFKWQKEMVDWYGYDNLVAFMEEAGDEFSGSNAFQTGKLAMSLDGDWRVAFIAAEASELKYGTAPLPADDARPDLYGSGYIAGTIIGIPSNAAHKPKAWKLVKYLATDDRALVKLSNGLRNVPSTRSSLRSPELDADERFMVFLDIFDHPRSDTTPITAAGADYQAMVLSFGTSWQAGLIPDLGIGLHDMDRRIETELKVLSPTRARAVAATAASAAALPAA